MRKFIFGFVAIIIVGIVVVALPKREKEDGEIVKIEDVFEDTASVDDGFHIETLSDHDIYFRPDSVLPDIPIVGDMVDMANGYAILRAAYCDAELWFRMGMVVNDAIGLLKTDVIKDDGVRAAAQQYVKTLVDILPRDTALWESADSELWDKVCSAYKSYAGKLSSRFALSRYGKFTEKDTEHYMDVKQFIPNYDPVYNLRKKQTLGNARYLWRMAEHSHSFDRRCIYTVEFAHQGVLNEAPSVVPMLETLMASDEYSRYLNEVWRIWRVLRQLQQSPSRDGMILNLEYNQMRFRCLNTILMEIVKNPKDIYAINDFCFLATYDNITRYNDYPYGNSTMLEKMMLFPETKDSADYYDTEEPVIPPVCFHCAHAKQICDAYWDVMCKTEEAESYFLFDITRDGIPELWLKVGRCEADYELHVYRWRKGKGARRIYVTDAGHSDFYYGKDYVLRQIAHMSIEWWTTFSYRGKIIERDVYQANLLKEGIDEYRKPKENMFEMLSAHDKAMLYACFGL